MPRLSVVRRHMDRLTTTLALAGAYTLLLASLLVCVDVTLRKLFAQSIVGTDELSGYALAVATSWGAAYAFFRGAHIRVDVVHNRLPVAAQAWLDVLAGLSMVVFGVLLAGYGLRELVDAITYGAAANTPLRTPLWIPLSAWGSGLVMFALAAVITTLEAAVAAARGDYARVIQLVGMGKGSEETPL